MGAGEGFAGGLTSAGWAAAGFFFGGCDLVEFLGGVVFPAGVVGFLVARAGALLGFFVGTGHLLGVGWGMSRLHEAALAFKDVLERLDACIDGIVLQPRSNEWLTVEQHAMLVNLQASGRGQMQRAENILGQAKWNRPDPSLAVQQAAELDEMTAQYEELYRNLLGTLNYARSQNGLEDVRDEDRMTN